MTSTLHYIKSPTDWPPPIRDFAQSICRPLPLTFIPHTRTVANFEDFATAMDSVPTPQTERDLISLSSIIAWTVRDLQRLSGCEAIDHGPHSTLFPVFNLIKALAYLLGPTLEIAADMSFLAPQGSEEFEGVAFAVVSHVVSKEDRSRAQAEEGIAQSDESDDIPEGASIDVTEEEGEEDVVNRWELDTEARDAYDANHPLWDTADREAQPVNRRYEIYGPFFHIYEGDDLKSETESSIDLPLEAHVEAASGPRTRATLPVVFAADWDNILLLSSSVLYQRQVWGVDLPVVGVCVYGYSPIVRLCFSWLDTNIPNKAELPHVHTALAAKDLAETSVGVFDLSSMAGALSFAQAVLGLKDQLHVIAAASKDNATTSFRWRSDNISIAEVAREERVSRWLRDVDSEEIQGVVNSATPNYLQESPPSANSDEMSRKRGPPITPSVTSHLGSGSYTGKLDHLNEKSPPPASTTPPGSRFLSPPSAGKSKKKSGRINAVDSVPSHSKLAETKDPSITDETMAAFLFDRNVCFVSLHGCDDVSASAMKNPSIAKDLIVFRAMAAQYKHLTRFGWPALWALEPHKSLPMTYFLDDERETLCCQYEVLPEDIKKSPLEPEVYDVLRDRFVFVLLASIGQYTRDAKLAKTRTVNEAEARHDWDGLLFHMYVSGTERISPNILLERRLQTCRNRHFDISIEDREKWAQRVYMYSWMHYTFCLSELRQATDGISPGDPGVVYPPEAPPARAVQAYLRAIWETNTARLNHSLIAVNTRPADSKLDILLGFLKKRVARETVLGICNAIAITPISWKDVDDEVLAKYRSFVQPVYNEHLRHPDEGQGLVIGFKTYTPDADQDQDADGKAPRRKAPPKAPDNGLNVPEEFPAELDQTLTDALHSELWKDLPVEEQQPLDIYPSSTNGLTTATPEVSQFKHQLPEDMETPHVADLWVPVIFGEYKKRDDATPLKAAGQARSYICSGVNFLGSVGIYDHPVLSLVTNGSRGAVIMGWKSSHSGNVYILERDICIFDISVPIQAYHFAIFLIRLRIWAKEQQELLKAKVIAHFKNTPVDQLEKWTKEAQALQYFEIHNPVAFSKESDEPVPAATAK